MTKRSTYRSKQRDFEKYFGDELSDQERHELESNALEDEFEAEAMEGWGEVPIETAQADLAELRERLKPGSKRFNWLKIAATVALLIVASAVILNFLNQKPETLAQDTRTEKSTVEKHAADKIPPPPEVTKPEPVQEETEEIIESPVANNLTAANDPGIPETALIDEDRETAPILQAISEVAEADQVATLDVSELDIVESDAEIPVQVLAAEGEDGAVKLRPGQQTFSVVSDDFFEVKSKGDRAYRQIQGNVFDEEGQIVSDARVVLSGTSILAVSDFNGKFEMAIPDSIVAPTLQFSLNGFDQLNYNVNDLDTFDVVLEKEDQPDFTNAFFSSRLARKRNEDVKIETSDALEEISPAPEVVASPEGGFKKYRKYLKKNTTKPAEANRLGIQGNVLIMALVSTSGELIEVKVKRGLGAGCDEEAIRVVKEGPSWNPALLLGEKVESTVEIEVKFD